MVREKLIGLGCNIHVEKHRVIENTEYIRLTISCASGIRVHIREFIVSGRVVRYSYQLVINEETVLRYDYDNALHHSEVETHPHHKRMRGEVYPLYDYSLEAFLDETLSIILSQVDGGSEINH